MAVTQLRPEFVERVWGSHALEPFFPDSPDRKIGEVWLTRTPPLPLLFKFLFTTEKLSVQVHPGGREGKTEMWHVLRAGPGSAVALGFRAPLTREQVRDAALSGTIEEALRWIPVRPGDTVFVPAGTVHAIGADLTICEIQQNADVTFRLYDYGRGRELHLDRGLAVADFGEHPGVSVRAGERLSACEYFVVDRLDGSGSRTVADGVVIGIAGQGRLDGQPLGAGQAYLVEGETRVEGSVDALLARVP